MSEPLRLWLLTDNKPGHRNQLAGLLNALAKITVVEHVWVDCTDLPLSWWEVWRGRTRVFDALIAEHGVPDVAVAAGHRTHRHLLAAGRALGAKTCVLMKPSLPLSWFDAAIVPAHDISVASDAHVLITEGVLNTVTPAQHGDTSRGLIVLGGVSQHYRFDETLLLTQINTLLQLFPALTWQLTDSRRTPAGFIDRLPRVDGLTITPWQETAPGWLANKMRESGMIWVTPDSVSMVYEALTAHVPVGVFDLPLAKKAGRVALGVQSLIDSGRVSSLSAVQSGVPMQRPVPPLFEAERAAKWLYGRFGQTRTRNRN